MLAKRHRQPETLFIHKKPFGEHQTVFAFSDCLVSLFKLKPLPNPQLMEHQRLADILPT